MIYLLELLETQPEIVVGFFVIAAAIVLSGLSQIHSSQHGTAQSQSFLDLILQGNPVQAAANLVNKATRFVVSHFAAAHLRMLARWFNSLGTLTLATYGIQRGWVEDAESALRSLFVKGDPTARRSARTAERTAERGVTRANRAQATASQTHKALTRYEVKTNAKVGHLTHAVDVAIPHDIGALRERNKALERGQAKTNDAVRSLEDGAINTFKWIRTHPLTATTGVFAGAVAVALGRLGLGGLRCNNFKNLLKHYGCGLGTLLGRLLPLAILLGTAFDFPEFVRAAEIVANGIGDAVGKIEGTFKLELPPLPPPQ